MLAVDSFPYAIELFKNSLDQKNHCAFQSCLGHRKVDYFENQQLTLMEQDITEYDFPSNQFDLVICTDVLPYIKPKKLKSLLQQIHETLIIEGLFIGTLFFSAPSSFNTLQELLNGKTMQQCFEEFTGGIGVHYYPCGEFIPDLLKDIGFEIQKINVRKDSSANYQILPFCYQFIAKKVNLKNSE